MALRLRRDGQRSSCCSLIAMPKVESEELGGSLLLSAKLWRLLLSHHVKWARWFLGWRDR